MEYPNLINVCSAHKLLILIIIGNINENLLENFKINTGCAFEKY